MTASRYRARAVRTVHFKALGDATLSATAAVPTAANTGDENAVVVKKKAVVVLVIASVVAAASGPTDLTAAAPPSPSPAHSDSNNLSASAAPWVSLIDVLVDCSSDLLYRLFNIDMSDSAFRLMAA